METKYSTTLWFIVSLALMFFIALIGSLFLSAISLTLLTWRTNKIEKNKTIINDKRHTGFSMDWC